MVWEIALAFFLLICSILILYLIPTVFEFRKTLAKITDVAETLQKDLPAILQNLNSLSSHVSTAGEQLKGAVGDIVEIEQKISKEIKEPVFEAVATLAGLLNGMQTFLTVLLKKKK
jgi:predicted PurR-regulated permease PerM